MNDLKVALSYEIKMKIREIKSMVKNLLTGLVIMSVIFLWMTFQFGKMIMLNLESIHFYRNQIILAISIVIILFTLMNKKAPLKWHPASMIHLAGSKFSTIFKLSIFKKTIAHAFLSIVIALSLNKFKVSFQAIQIFSCVYNLLTASLVSKYFIYNKGLNIKVVRFLVIFTAALNFQLYLNKYLSIIVILTLTYISILSIKEALNTDFNFHKSFIDMVFINRANSLAKGNRIEDTQEFVREKTAEKSRKNPILKNIKFKNPLIQKNVITFSRINLTLSIYIFIIFTVAIVLYRFEIFDFVRLMKELNLGLPIVALNQTLFINNIINLIMEQKNLLIAKSKEGLYLPYKKREINYSFMMLGIPILFMATLMVGILLQKPMWITGVALFVYSIILLITLCFEKKKGTDFFDAIINFAIFGVSYLLIWVV